MYMLNIWPDRSPGWHPGSASESMGPDIDGQDFTTSTDVTLKHKTLLLVSTHFPPSASVATHNVIRWAKFLSRAGVKVIVLTLPQRSYLPSIKTDEQLLKRLPPNIRVYRVSPIRGLLWLTKLRNMLRPAATRRKTGAGRHLLEPDAAGNISAGSSRSAFQKCKDCISGLFSIPDNEAGWLLPGLAVGWFVILRHKVDVVLSLAPPWTCHVVSTAIAGMTRRQLVLDFNDPWALSPWAMSRRSAWETSLHEWLERRTINAADAVFANTPSLRHELITQHGARLERKCSVLSNGYDRDILKPFSSMGMKKNTRCTITYAGSLYKERTPFYFIQAVKRLVDFGAMSSPDLQVLFVGGSEFEFSSRLKEWKVDQIITHIPWMPHERVLQVLAESDAFLVIQPKTTVQVPVKLFEYMVFGKPILALAPQGELSQVIDHGRLGFVATPDDVEHIASGILSLIDMSCGKQTFAPNVEFIEQFDAERQMESALRSMDELLARSYSTAERTGASVT